VEWSRTVVFGYQDSTCSAPTERYAVSGGALDLVETIGSDCGLGLVAGDIDGDGDDDLAICSYLGGYALDADLSVHLQDSDGELSTDYPLNTYTCYSMLLSDFDGDGGLDLVAGRTVDQTNESNHTDSVVFWNSGGRLGDATSLFSTAHAARFGVGDLDLDGREDLVVAHLGDRQTDVFTSMYQRAAQLQADASEEPRNAILPLVADLDADGADDVLVLQSVPAGSAVWWNNHHSPMDWTVEPLSIPYGAAAQMIDLDGDGYDDLIVGSAQGAAGGAIPLMVWYGGASGVDPGAAPDEQIGSHYVADLAAGDLDCDGDVDIAVADSGGDNVVYVNDGAGFVPASAGAANGREVEILDGCE